MNPLSQYSQCRGLLLVWVNKWCSSSVLDLNFAKQWTHSLFFSFSWILFTCAIMLPFNEKLFEQTLHWKFLSFLLACTKVKCDCRKYLDRKVLSHLSHWWGRRFKWMDFMCTFKADVYTVSKVQILHFSFSTLILCNAFSCYFKLALV